MNKFFEKIQQNAHLWLIENDFYLCYYLVKS